MRKKRVFTMSMARMDLTGPFDWAAARLDLTGPFDWVVPASNRCITVCKESPVWPRSPMIPKVSMSVEPTAGSVLKDCIPLVNNDLLDEEEEDEDDDWSEKSPQL